MKTLKLCTVTALLSLAAPGCATTERTLEQAPTQNPEASGSSAWPELSDRLAHRNNRNRARNVIVFIADGMGPTLTTAARIYQGQLRGEEGEENYLAFERLPHVAFAKTYATDAQIPDSAATASAIMTGVKTGNGRVSVYPEASQFDCAANSETPANLAEVASSLGKRSGVVTTSYVVDASPAAVYGHAGERSWVLPQYVPEEARENGCKDLALQLIESDIAVALGGGRTVLYPPGTEDPEDGTGSREDGLDLVDRWTNREKAAFVWNREQLNALDLESVDRLLGLFARAAMFGEEGDAARANPSLAEMTQVAIRMLSRSEEGYVLVVEHEGTDEHQHAGHVKRAMESVHELDDAVAAALRAVDLDDTLVIVTADHGQPLAFGGFAPKGNPILGLAREEGSLHLAEDGKPYTTLGFYTAPQPEDGPRPDLTEVDTSADDFIPPSAVPTQAVYHSGSDVAVYAAGPWAHLFTGVMEQNTINHIIRHAMTSEADS